MTSSGRSTLLLATCAAGASGLVPLGPGRQQGGGFVVGGCAVGMGLDGQDLAVHDEADGETVIVDELDHVELVTQVVVAGDHTLHAPMVRPPPPLAKSRRS
jgi:hypothetical protein